MDPVSRSLRLEHVEWRDVLPWLRLFRAFRMAIQPAKLGLALVMVLLLYLGGRVVDATGWWGLVHSDEIEQWKRLDRQAFEQWWVNRPDWLRNQLHELLAELDQERRTGAQVEDLSQALIEAADLVTRQAQRDYERWRAQAGEPGGPEQWQEPVRLQREWLGRREAIERLKPQGVFAATLEAELRGFERLIRAASGLRFGLVELVRDRQVNRDSVLGALGWMFVTVPAWLAQRHPGFLMLMAVYAMVLWALLGGAVARLAAVEACTGQRQGAGVGLRFVRRKWGWLIGTPLLPVAVAVFIGLVLALFGMVFFNWPVLDIVGGGLYGLAILAGLMMVILLVGLVLGGGLLYPALAVEDTDGFDAVSRSFHYLWNRPWQWGAYQIVALVYGAVCYLIVAGLVFLAAWLAQQCVELGVFRQVGLGLSRFQAIAPEPKFGQLATGMETGLLDPSGQVAAVLVRIWVMITLAALAAFAVSFYLCANTWIYLLLRRSADGTDFDELAQDRDQQTAGQQQSIPVQEPLVRAAEE